MSNPNPTNPTQPPTAKPGETKKPEHEHEHEKKHEHDPQEKK